MMQHEVGQVEVFLMCIFKHLRVDITRWVVERIAVDCLQAKAPDASLMTIREDAEELESALNKLDQQARYCVIYAIVSVKLHWVLMAAQVVSFLSDIVS